MKPLDLPASMIGTAIPDAAPARALMDQSQTGLFIAQDGQVCYANQALSALLLRGVDELVGVPYLSLFAPEFRAHAQAAVIRRLAGKAGRAGESQCLRQDGSRVDVRVLARRIDFQGRAAVMITVLDITELKEALRRAEWNASMLARTEALCRAGSFDVSWPTGELRMSGGLATLLGLPDDAPRDGSIDNIAWVPPEERAFVGGIWRSAAAGEAFEFQHRVQGADGVRRVVLHRGLLGTDGHGVALLQDITDRLEAEQRIEALATRHEVTGLPNRAWLLDQLDAAMHAARWESRGFALLAIDIPRIAEVKANMGFGAGDTLAMALAARLREACGEGELLAQPGETEFVIVRQTGLWTGSCSSGDGGDDAALRALADKLCQALDAPVRLGTTDVYPRCQIGIARFPRDGEAPDKLLEGAQTARLGDGGVAFFTPQSNIQALRAMQIEGALWQAVQHNELSLHYQPQVDLTSGAVCGAEALLRWHSPQLGNVSPAEFIPVAERSGLIGAIGEWVLQAACEQIAAWQRAGLPMVRIGVNLSAAQLQRPDLAQHVQSVLLQTGASPALLGIEITESMVMQDVTSASATLRALKAIGVKISLDDFGTGFSSMSALAQLPVDVVKIDRSLVNDVSAKAQDVSITRAIVQMTHALRMRSLAEGVETEGQLALLVAAGCDEFQGYWFSKPLPGEAFEALLREGKRVPQRFVSGVRQARQRTLLLVGDDEAALSRLERLLQSERCELNIARSGAEGLQRMADQPVDVVIADQQMAGMSGIDFLSRVKALFPHTMRLVLAASAELPAVVAAVSRGTVHQFVTKPWHAEQLRAHVNEAFRQKEVADQNRRLAQQVEQANAGLAAANQRFERSLVQQREQTELLTAGADRMREVLDELPAAVLAIDGDETLVFVNREAERLLPGCAGALGGPLDDAVPEDFLVQMRAAIAGGATQQVRLEAAEFLLLAAPTIEPAEAPSCRLLLLCPCPLENAA